MPEDFDPDAVLVDGQACVCDASPCEHGWDPAAGCGPWRKVPLGGMPIFDPSGPGIIGRMPAPAPHLPPAAGGGRG